MTWTLRTTLNWASDYFSQKQLASPRLDAELLLAEALQLSRVQLYMDFDRPLNTNELAHFKSLIQRRASREPVAYILGRKEFYSLNFQVNSAVLIPRPETEELVEAALQHLKARNLESAKILDLATGSGCILISILKNFENAQGLGVDISESALTVAKGNAVLHQVDLHANWIQHDLSLGWPAEVKGPFDLITANLPYVSEADWQELEPELKNFEPRAALVPGPHGDESFFWILPFLENYLKPGGMALLEIGCDQGKTLLEQAVRHCKESRCDLLLDLSNRERFLRIMKKLTTTSF